MVRFVDKYLGPKIQGWPVEVAPMFSTQITVVDSGAEQANQRWYDPLREINVPQGVRNHDTFETLRDHWLIMAGPARTWPWRDPTDFASVALTEPNLPPVIDAEDQALGVGDGFTVSFQLNKRYDIGSPATPYDRPIRLPVVDTVVVAIDGVDPSVYSPPLTWSVSRYGGVVTFTTPPPPGAVLTAGFLFDLIVRFDGDDTFRGIMQTYGVSGFADIPMREVRYCED